MIFIYNIVVVILAIILLPVILIAFILQPKFRAGFKEKIGFYSYDMKGNKTVIFHAVSVGEVNAIKELVKEYKIKNPDDKIIITTTTATGQEIAQKSLIQYADKITYFPYDFFFSVLSFFNTYKPEKIIIAETEIWPCFISLAKLKDIKIYMVNGRISPKSFNGYRKIKLFIEPILKKYEKIFMQSNDDAQRLINLGANKNTTEVMGNLKFDISQNIDKAQIDNYINELKTSNYRIFIAASTHKGEDEIVLSVFKKLKEKNEDVKLLLAPRHPQRYCEVTDLISSTGFKFGKRSSNDNFDEKDIILLDTMGELSKLYSICYLAFIGGSFSSTGGHNPLEASIWEKPVISGPCIFNFKDVYKIEIEKKCAVIVNSEEEFIEEAISFYSDKNKYVEYCKNAKSVFDENRGAISYVLQRI